MRSTNALFFAAISIFGCSSSNDAAPGASGGKAGIDQWCSAFCAADEKCNSKVDDTTCENDCHTTLAGTGPHLRADYVAGFTSCIGSDACSDVQTLGGNCTRQAKASIAPTSTAQDFCNAAAQKAKDCGKSSDVATCLDQVKVFDDASLSAAKDCLSKACDQYEACAASSVGVVP